MKNLLIRCSNLFIGDILFASSVSNYFTLREKYDVDFCVDFLQPIELLNNHKNIRKAYFNEMGERYDRVIDLKPLKCQDIPATTQFFMQAGIPEEFWSLGYSVYTNSSCDYTIGKFFDQERRNGKKIVAYQVNWEEKSFLFTKDEYNKGIDVPGLGYGGKRRNIKYILDILSKVPYIHLIPVGQPVGKSQRDFDIYSTTSYTFAASLMAQADYVIGSEGGITNCGAGVGTKCIITTDFIHQLYGWNGCIRKHKTPTMGPVTYFPDAGHVHLDPFLTDKEVSEQIIKNIR